MSRSLSFNHCFIWQVADVKKTIESTQGADIYPAAQLMLIHQGKVLKDGTTLEENKVAENSFVVVMLTKVKDDLLLLLKQLATVYMYSDIDLLKLHLFLFLYYF